MTVAHTPSDTSRMKSDPGDQSTAEQERALAELHDEMMSEYSKLMAKWRDLLPVDQVPSLCSTYRMTDPSVEGYTALIATILVDRVDDQSVARTANYISSALRTE